MAKVKNLATIAFPAISTGIYGYPLDQAAQVSSQMIKEFLEKNRQPEEVRLIFFYQEDAEEFIKHQVF